ncbi:NAD-dependent epimerase/dehydratase family protein [Zavarzinia compransoris]|uniref:UDP-glucuronate 5-epimerase n=1 Tax=Zavarzinia compransoris TaxID=1264899 RepID=A0A317EC20_9PROT|nr:NAD-dependent epimerase/dehydratase family protein [Zavarzinia compransoris]PWR23816.1 UDP-glucuronate 5-epimerase [Zavarzinia compransoris]TDP48049.1 UDP-glucuronate 4-epimerase [Zavarzinia compransoris]
MRFLITGTAGFIGFHMAKRLLDEGHEVFGLDGMTPYYDPRLKEGRNAVLSAHPAYRFEAMRLEEAERVMAFAKAARPDVVFHFAAQAGVRYSLENPRSYVDSNLVGTFNLMEAARETAPRHLIMASTSSAYGGNREMPFRETHGADHPLTLYAATKKATEAMAHSYAHLWQIPTTMLRFFTVYGPWGRPDMALFKFVDGILNGRPIDIYGEGRMSRDFTYVGDLVEAMARLIERPPADGGEPLGAHDSLSPVAPFRVVNIGGGQPVPLLDFVDAIEDAVGLKARRNMLPMQKGDVTDTFASADLLRDLTGYVPSTPVRDGVRAFVSWYRQYHGNR